MIKALVTAPRGHMGSLIVKAAWERKDIEVTAAVGTPGRDYIGKDSGTVAGLGREIDAPVYDDIEKAIEKCQIVIDFSTVELSIKVLESCLSHGKAFLCGTTGFDESQTNAILEAGRSIPVMKAANTSYVVSVMRKLLGEAALKLGSRCGIEIIEMHSQTKKDAPSGTAIELAEEMASWAPDKKYEDIAFHSVRAGNTPSTHRVIFGCMGERLEISHDAYDWECYALGACDAAVFMARQPAGVYTMDDLIESEV